MGPVAPRVDLSLAGPHCACSPPAEHPEGVSPLCQDNDVEVIGLEELCVLAAG